MTRLMVPKERPRKGILGKNIKTKGSIRHATLRNVDQYASVHSGSK